MANSAYVLYKNAALEPSATSVSILGARFHSALKPLMKKRWLMTMTITVSKSCASPIATWFPSKNEGSRQPHIMCPMEIYIRTSKKPRDQNSLLLSFGVS